MHRGVDEVIESKYGTKIYGGSIGLPAGTPCDRVLACVFSYNEGEKLRSTLSRFPPDLGCDILVVDDGSTDGSIEKIEGNGIDVLRMGRTIGLGAAIRAAIRYAQGHGYHIISIMAANDKDRADEIPRLLAPIQCDGYLAVFGSRYLPGGNFGNMPFYRTIATRYVHPLLFRVFAGGRLTDTSNGFRAFHLSLFSDPYINLDQSWLDQYEMERYIQFKVITRGYKYLEVPVTKIYPPKQLGQTKMTPITGWWSMLKPIFLLGLRLRT